MLKSLPFILFFTLAVSGSLVGKEASDSTKSQPVISIGIRCGLYFSNLSAPAINPNGPPFGFSTYVVEDNGSRAGAYDHNRLEQTDNLTLVSGVCFII